jgi:hypothetical protein
MNNDDEKYPNINLEQTKEVIDEICACPHSKPYVVDMYRLVTNMFI